jgi:hypothetical protein
MAPMVRQAIDLGVNMEPYVDPLELLIMNQRPDLLIRDDRPAGLLDGAARCA